MFKKILCLLFVIALTIAGIYGGRWYLSYRKQITGDQWFEKQQTYVDEMKTFGESMDKVVTLYLTKSIDQEDLLNHADTFNSSLIVMKRKYEQDKKDHPVRTGSYTYLTKKGCESVEKCYPALSKMVYMLTDGNYYRDRDKLSYEYLACEQPLIKNMSAYYSCKKLYNQQKKAKS